MSHCYYVVVEASSMVGFAVKTLTKLTLTDKFALYWRFQVSLPVAFASQQLALEFVMYQI